MVLLMLMLLVGFNSINTVAQTPELNIRSVKNGLRGEYKSGNKKLFVEHRVPTTDFSVSRIQNSNKQTIVETVFDKNVVTVKVKDVTLVFHLDKKNYENSKISELSEADVEKLRKFSLSEESAPIRKLIAELIKQKTGTEVGQLKGFVTIAMILGDGPGAPEELQSKANCSSPKLVQMYASYRSQSPQKIQQSNAANTTNSTANDCWGCCGAGCWSCTGCWTNACSQHDTCVVVWGYTHSYCMVMLAAAVASMRYECGLY